MRSEVDRKMAHARQKLHSIIRSQRPALMLGGIMGTDMRIAKAAYEGGARIFEPNHPAMALQMGLCGVQDMFAAEQIRHLVPVYRMVDAVRGLRAVLGNEVFITVGCRGTFTEAVPTPFTLQDALELSQAGADCLHTHKSSFQDVEQITAVAHEAGLLAEAYITSDDDLGVPAPTDQQLVDAVRTFESIGVDLIGITTGMTYQGQQSGLFTPAFLDRVGLFVRTAKVVKILEGGIRQENISQVRNVGLDILVVSTALDHSIEAAAKAAVAEIVGR